MASAVDPREEIIEYYHSVIGDLRHELEQIESGWRKIDLRTGADFTERCVERIKRSIAVYEGVSAYVEKRVRDS